MVRDVSDSLEKFETLFADRSVHRNSYNGLFTGYIHLTHRLRMLNKAHQLATESTNDPLIAAARLYKDPDNVRREDALGALRGILWKTRALMNESADNFQPVEHPWDNTLKLLQRSHFKAWRVLHELCGLETDPTIEYEPETAWSVIYYINATRNEAVSAELPKIPVSKINDLIPHINAWIASKSPDCHSLEVVVTALLESLPRVEWDSHAPPQSLTHLVSKYMRQLASCPTPWQVKLPWPQPNSGRNLDFKDTRHRISLNLNHGTTFNFVQLALATEIQALVAAELYGSFQALAARLTTSDEGSSSGSTRPGSGSPRNPKLSDELRERIEKVHTTYKERQEAIQQDAQAGQSSTMDPADANAHPELRPDHDNQQKETPPGGLVVAETSTGDGVSMGNPVDDLGGREDLIRSGGESGGKEETLEVEGLITDVTGEEVHVDGGRVADPVVVEVIPLIVTGEGRAVEGRRVGAESEDGGTGVL